MYSRHDSVEISQSPAVIPELRGEVGTVVSATATEATVWIKGVYMRGLYVFPKEVLIWDWSPPFKVPTFWNRLVWGHTLQERWDVEQDAQLAEAGYSPLELKSEAGR